MVGGDRGQLGGGEGNDSIVGGRSTAASDRTVIHGNPGNDTIVSGLGNDEVFGDAGANTLAYASVQQQGIDIVDRGTNGVPAILPNAGPDRHRRQDRRARDRTSSIPTSARSSAATATTSSSATTSPTRSSVSLPPGTAGVKPGPAGNDVLAGSGGNDLMLGAEGNDSVFGGADNDVLLAAAGNDLPRRRRRRRQLQRRRRQRQQLRPRRRRRGDHLWDRDRQRRRPTRSTRSPPATASRSAPRWRLPTAERSGSRTPASPLEDPQDLDRIAWVDRQRCALGQSGSEL